MRLHRIAASLAVALGLAACAQSPFARQVEPLAAGGSAAGPTVGSTVGPTVLFAPGSHTVSDADRAALMAWAATVRVDPTRVVAVEGHADRTGPARENLGLGYRRAEEVRRILVDAAGLPSERVAVASHGEAWPAQPRAGLPGDRRVVVALRGMSAAPR